MDQLDDDDYVASLLKNEARSTTSTYELRGLPSRLSSRSTGTAPKPNTRFLRNIVRDADFHNAALLAKEAAEAKSRLRRLQRGGEGRLTRSPSPAKINSSHQSRRARDAYNRSKSPDRHPHHRHRRRDRRSKSKSPGRRREGHPRLKSPGRRREGQSRSKSPDSRSERQSRSRSPGQLRERRSRSKSPARRRERRSRSKSPGRRRERRSRSKSPGRRIDKHPKLKGPGRPRGGRSKSRSPDRRRLEPKTRDKSSKSRSRSLDGRRDRRLERRERSGNENLEGRKGREGRKRSPSLPSHTRESRARNDGLEGPTIREKRRKRSVSWHRTNSVRGENRSKPRKQTTEFESGSLETTGSPCSTFSDPLEELIGPSPPPNPLARGRGATGQAAMDSRFLTSYDPATDVRLDSDKHHTDEDFDDALKAYRDRQKWKQQGAERLRSAGLGEDFIKAWENNDTKNEASLKWAKKGSTREWDRGKVLDDDTGARVDLRADWIKK